MARLPPLRATPSGQAGTVDFYRYCLQSLGRSSNGKQRGEIHPFLIEKHKQTRIAVGHRVAVNRDLTDLSVPFNRCREWKKYEGENPLRSVKKMDEPLTKLRFLSDGGDASRSKYSQFAFWNLLWTRF